MVDFTIWQYGKRERVPAGGIITKMPGNGCFPADPGGSAAGSSRNNATFPQYVLKKNLTMF